jgi:hypothetical protein
MTHERDSFVPSGSASAQQVPRVQWAGASSARDLEPRRDHLYVIESACGAIKIGRSIHPAVRMRGLEMQAPPGVSLAMLTVLEDFGHHEFTLHEALDDHRVRGEWFTAEAAAIVKAVIAGRGLADWICELAAEQTAPRYVARNKRFAQLRAHLKKIEDEKQAERDRLDMHRLGPLKVGCPLCGVAPLVKCRTPDDEPISVHGARFHVWNGRKPPHQSMYKLELHIEAGHHGVGRHIVDAYPRKEPA